MSKALVFAVKDSGPGPALALPGLTGRQRHDPRSTQTVAPAYSFGSRPASRVNSVGPGPATLYPTGTRNGKDYHAGYSISGRVRQAHSSKSPGPAAYTTDTFVTRSRAPQYSMRPLTAPMGDKSVTPGPNAFDVPSLLGPSKVTDSRKRTAPAPSLSGRHASQTSSHTPGPGAYGLPSLDTYRQRAPALHLHAKTRTPAAAPTPGPGAYTPDFRSSSSFRHDGGRTMAIRHSPYVVGLSD